MAHHPSPVYGRMQMFRALRMLAKEQPGVGLAVFGPGTRTPEFARDARERMWRGSLEDLGELDHDEALGLISRCDVFIRPTTHDGDSVSVREALTLGVPCVASDVCARPEGTYLFQGGHPPDLAKRIRQALAEGPAQVAQPDAGPCCSGCTRSTRHRGSRIGSRHGRRNMRRSEDMDVTRRALRGRDLVVFSNDWDGDPLSKIHIMRILSRENRVLWVNSIGNRAPKANAHDAAAHLDASCPPSPRASARWSPTSSCSRRWRFRSTARRWCARRTASCCGSR